MRAKKAGIVIMWSSAINAMFETIPASIVSTISKKKSRTIILPIDRELANHMASHGIAKHRVVRAYIVLAVTKNFHKRLQLEPTRGVSGLIVTSLFASHDSPLMKTSMFSTLVSVGIPSSTAFRLIL